MEAFIISNEETGIDFTIRVVEKGDTYGVGFGVTYEKYEPMVEIYDTRYEHSEYGQFVASYYVNTLLHIHEGQKLHMIDYEPEWYLTAYGVHEMKKKLAKYEV